jgi:hypothetical protein
MGLTIEVESDTGDILNILRTDGFFGGKAIETFTSIYSGIEFLDEQSHEYQWFRKLEEITEINLKLICSILYAGNWDYGEEEYDRFKRCGGYGSEISEEDFRNTVKAVYAMWTPLEIVIEVVEEIVRLLSQMGKETYWFSPHETIKDFQGLLDTLLLARHRKAKEVRLRVV